MISLNIDIIYNIRTFKEKKLVFELLAIISLNLKLTFMICMVIARRRDGFIYKILVKKNKIH